MSKRKSGAPLHFRKQIVGGALALVASDEEAGDWLRRRKVGDVIAMSADQVRNAERSALYWVLMGLVAENSAEIESKESASAVISILAGNVQVGSYVDDQGKRRFLQWPKSLAFANMGEDEFAAYFGRALDVISTTLLPGVDIEELRREAYLKAGVNDDHGLAKGASEQ